MAKTAKTRVAQAIETSVREDRIVHLAQIEDATDLLAECEDHAEVDGIHQYWGTTEDGHEWRVHLAIEWHARDEGGGDGDGRPLPIPAESVGDLDLVEQALCAWLSEGDWGDDDGPDLVTGCSGRARRNDWAEDGSRDVDASVWVRRSNGDWGQE